MGPPDPNHDFWEDPEVVERFATRDPDLRLVELITEYDEPEATVVLDIGCAGGRNSVLLAEHGFDLHARDTSSAMVAETRRRVAKIMGTEEAEARVRVGRMDELSDFDDESIDLVLSLGVLHNATSLEEWERTLHETVRTLKAGGRFLVSTFTPETDPTGTGVSPVPGTEHLYHGLHGGPAILLEPETLDRELGRFGLKPETPTTIGRTISGEKRRVSANGLYVKG